MLFEEIGEDEETSDNQVTIPLFGSIVNTFSTTFLGTCRDQTDVAAVCARPINADVHAAEVKVHTYFPARADSDPEIFFRGTEWLQPKRPRTK